MPLVGVRGITSFTALGYYITEDDQELDDGVVAQLREAAGLAGVLLTVDGVTDQPPGVPGDTPGPTVQAVLLIGTPLPGQTVVWDDTQQAFVPADPGGTWE